MPGGANISWVDRTIDSDVSSYFTATSITDNNLKAAIEKLTFDLKDQGLWSLGSLINPVAGGSAGGHKINLKDSRDVDAAFRLLFSGGWTHSSTGMLPNGTTGYANSFLNPNTVYSSGLMSMGVYSRTNYNVARCDMGVHDATDTKNASMWCWFDGNIAYGLPCTDNIAVGLTIASSDSRGWFFTSRTDSTNFYLQKNNTIFDKTSSVGVPNNPLYVGARNVNNAADFPSNRELAFVWVGSPLTKTQAQQLYLIIDNYQKLLNRNV